MRLTKSVGQVIGVAVVLILEIVALRFLPNASASASSPLTKTYANAAWGFSLKMPADFSAYPPGASPERDAMGAPTIQAMLLQNAAGVAVQITITQGLREGPSNTLTTEDIEQQAYLDLSEAVPIQITPIITGVIFTDTKHPTYGTSTDEVWFAHRGNLY